MKLQTGEIPHNFADSPLAIRRITRLLGEFLLKQLQTSLVE
jgi:hypothetical protein